MRIKDKHLYHGAALTQVVEHESFKALNKADEGYGHYQINHDRRLLAKHSAADGNRWQFTFHTADTATLRRDRKKGRSFVCLICGWHTVCALNETELDELLDLSSTQTQTINVHAPEGKGMRVHGSAGSSSRIIAHSSFPGKLFE